MTDKFINANTPWGQYRFPAAVVATDRAAYYGQGGDEVFNEEYDYTLSDNYELLDWLLNNMDWDDVRSEATKFSDDVLVLEEDFWTNSDDFEVMEGLSND